MLTAQNTGGFTGNTTQRFAGSVNDPPFFFNFRRLGHISGTQENSLLSKTKSTIFINTPVDNGQKTTAYLSSIPVQVIIVKRIF